MSEILKHCIIVSPQIINIEFSDPTEQLNKRKLLYECEETGRRICKNGIAYCTKDECMVWDEFIASGRH